MTYILVDTANTFFRARHVVRGELHDKLGLSIHTVLTSIRKAWKDFNGTHVVFCLEGRSWRKDVYPPYKRQRSEARAAMSPREAEEETAFWEAFDKFKDFYQDVNDDVYGLELYYEYVEYVSKFISEYVSNIVKEWKNEPIS